MSKNPLAQGTDGLREGLLSPLIRVNPGKKNQIDSGTVTLQAYRAAVLLDERPEDVGYAGYGHQAAVLVLSQRS